MAYKVLDVRETTSTFSYTDQYNTYDCTKTVFAVIAQDIKGNRKRFMMYDGYKSLFLGDWNHYGYKGDFDILVKGDWFEIEDTSRWPVVKILGVSEEEV